MGTMGNGRARFFTCHVLPITTAYGVSSDRVGSEVCDSKGVKSLISLELWELVVVQQVAEAPRGSPFSPGCLVSLSPQG